MTGTPINKIMMNNGNGMDGGTVYWIYFEIYGPGPILGIGSTSTFYPKEKVPNPFG